MSLQAVLLDTGPLGLATKRRGVVEADACLQWVADLNLAGIRVFVSEVADYEVRRELLRAGNAAGIRRLNVFNRVPGRYRPITTEEMRLAADLWAKARNGGWATADPHALDGDVILAAQALMMGQPAGEIVVATMNVRHISRYVAADLWQNIGP